MAFTKTFAGQHNSLKKKVPQSRPVIRQAEKKDAETVFMLTRLLAEYHGEEADFRATLKDVLRDGFGERPLYESWLAEIDGVALALATFFITYSTFKGKACLHLDNLYVKEDARGWKLGEKLIAQVKLRANELNCYRLELEVHQHNPARVFYEKLGFSESPDRVYILAGENLS
jgi:GNAT superfamily N-acetyltransferase